MVSAADRTRARRMEIDDQDRITVTEYCGNKVTTPRS